MDRPVISGFTSGMPAESAGFERNDVILAINGTPIADIEQLQEYIQGREGDELIVTVRRAGAALDVRVTPEADPNDGVVRIGISVTTSTSTGVGMDVVNDNVALAFGVMPFGGGLPDGEQQIVLEQQVAPEIVALTDSNPAVLWQFEAVAAGETGLSLALARPAGGSFEINALFQVLVRVSAAETTDAGEVAAGMDDADNEVPISPDSPAADGAAVVITGAKNGQTIGLQNNDRLVIELDANRTTAYFWRLDAVDESVLRPGEPSYEPDEVEPGAVGAGGTLVWPFEAVGPGETRIKLVYVSEGEAGAGDDDIREVFELTVIVE